MSSAPLRLEIEHVLRHRFAGALSPRPRVERPLMPTGVAELDDLLGGGLPFGAISEMVGPPCSGRASLALAFTAQITQSARVGAWIDVEDSLDPESAAAAGVDLARLLWVRCGRGPTQAQTAMQEPTAAIATGLLNKQNRVPAPPGGCGSPHPRGESRGMPEAIQAFLQTERWCTSENPGAPGEEIATLHRGPMTRSGENAGETRRLRKKLGTPGMPNRPLGRTLDREEQPPTDRMPSRRGAGLRLEPRHPVTVVPHCAEAPAARLEVRQPRSTHTPILQTSGLPKRDHAHVRKQSWQALDQALRAADLLLSAGGFGALVLDLGSTPPEMAWRIPLATWFRFRAAAERSRTAVVLLTQHPCARSSAELVLELSKLETQSESTVLTGVLCEAAIARQRFDPLQSTTAHHVVPIRKPPQGERSARWTHAATWNGSAS